MPLWTKLRHRIHLRDHICQNARSGLLDELIGSQSLLLERLADSSPIEGTRVTRSDGDPKSVVVRTGSTLISGRGSGSVGRGRSSLLEAVNGLVVKRLSRLDVFLLRLANSVLNGVLKLPQAGKLAKRELSLTISANSCHVGPNSTTGVLTA